MSEANETNDILTKIKEQIMIATHETGEMPKIMKSKKKADSNRGYFYDAQNNILYLKDEQTWNAIKGNLSADLSSDDMGINVSIQPLQGIDGYQGESIEDLQDKVDKVNRENHREYYRLIKRGDSDFLLCYSFNNVADRDRFAAEMDDALVVGSSDVSDGAKFDKDDDDEEIDEDFSDDEVLDAPSRRKQNDKQKEKAKVNKKKQKDDEKKKNDDNKKKKDDEDKKKKDDDITKDNEEGEQEVTLVEELGDTQVNQTGGTQVNDNSVSGNAGGSGKTEQAIEARFAEVNAQDLPNRYAYLEQYCRIAKEFGEPDGYSLSKDMGKRKVFEVGDYARKSYHCKAKKLQEMCRENLLMHMLADILPAISGGGKVVHYRDDTVNKLYIEGPDETVNLDSVLNHESVRNSVFAGYFRDLMNRLKPVASEMTLTKKVAAECVINFITNDLRMMLSFLQGGSGYSWQDLKGGDMPLGYGSVHPNGLEERDKAILPFGWMRGDDFKQVRDVNGQAKWRLTPKTVGIKAHTAAQYETAMEMTKPQPDDIMWAAKLAFSCGDMFPSGELRKDLYYCCWAQYLKNQAQYDVAYADANNNYLTYFNAGSVNKRKLIEALKQERLSKRGRRDFMTTFFSPGLRRTNWRKLFSAEEMDELEGISEGVSDWGSRCTPPIIRNYEITKQNLNNGFARDVPHF